MISPPLIAVCGSMSIHVSSTPAFLVKLAAREPALPDYVQREFEDTLACGRLERGFVRVRCHACNSERFIAFSCKRGGFRPSCGARRMAESAALLIDEIFPRRPIRQLVLSVPFALRFLAVIKCIVAHLDNHPRAGQPPEHPRRGPPQLTPLCQRE